jgi:CDP-glycerol glycerophosphotransferase (TagB/SpsB family)
VTSSEHEYNEVLSEDYGYDKSVVKLTGLPRYDSIHDDNKKKILFAPTWRFSVFNVPKNELVESDYYKTICRLLCDKDFIGKLKEHGYGLSFKAHPMLAGIASDFEADDYAEIIPYDVSYQTLFAESSILITDFSSTAFDFAYLKKPVIYYHFFENHMGKSYFDYETMGFGEVIADYDRLITMVLEYIENDCIMKDEYKQRVNDFFAYFDKNNTRRVYDEIIKM